MNNRAERRTHLLELLSGALHEDERIGAAVLVGSGAIGFRDDESDIDIVAPVLPAYDAGAVFRDWRGRLMDVIGASLLAETAATRQEHLLVAYCDNLLEVDISFPSLDTLMARSSRWRLLWERTGEVTHRLATSAPGGGIDRAQMYVWTLNRAVHRVTSAARALRRAEAWKAILQLDELRVFALQLACLDLFDDPYVDSHLEELPPAVLAAFDVSLPANALVDNVRDSLNACVRQMLVHASSLDIRHGVERSTNVGSVLNEHLRA